MRERDPRFAFEARLHATGDKLVLGTEIRAGGRGEGDRVLRLLAAHPSTARFIAWKLARRFVSDPPPPALVERAAEAFRSSGGTIREVVRTIVESAAFGAPEARAALVKTPFEFVASALRAADAELEDALGLARHLEELGMPLYAQPPTGHEAAPEGDLSPTAQRARSDFARELVSGKLPGVLVRPEALAGLALGSPEFQRK
jgi:uncharacterized protein (DUF1800 family)